MICRTCLRRVSGLRPNIPSVRRPFSLAVPRRSATQAETPSSAAAPPAESPLINPHAAADADAGKPALSSCPEGTVLKGLNYFKGREDPVALADDEYPAWLWRCLDDTRKVDVADEDEGDEFCASFPFRPFVSSFFSTTCAEH